MNRDEYVLSGKKLVDIAVKKALEKKAENIVIFNPGTKSGIAEWFLICHGNNVIQNKAITDAILSGLKEENTIPWHKEGFEEGRWILLDYSDVVINILLPEIRDYYELEKLWEDFPRIDISDDR
jgi:ribosome-associated protein